ncbi:MAG: tetratricopeptide repeat protein [Deltaproteobacteria bacterium]|nr:tetratricopeptide repeat protein [Deltaproteobacteria bacterium]
MKLAISLTLVAALSSTVSADKADTLFKKAKKLLSEKRYAEACKTFEEVVKLDKTALGGLLNAGKCYEEWGRLARAYDWYEKAQVIAAEQKDDRADKIKALVEELDTNVPRLTLKITDGADLQVLASITLDGKPFDQGLLGSEIRVDPGPHVIEYIVDGKKKKKMVPVERGGSSEILLDLPKGKPIPDGPEDKDKDPVVPEAPTPPGRNQRIAGIVVGSAGVVAVGVASALTLSARGKWKDAIDEHCMGSTSMCDPTGLDITADARSRANKMTIVAIVGGAAIIGGVVLYLTAPSSETAVRITPVVTDDGAAVFLGGGF